MASFPFAYGRHDARKAEVEAKDEFHSGVSATSESLRVHAENHGRSRSVLEGADRSDGWSRPARDQAFLGG